MKTLYLTISLYCYRVYAATTVFYPYVYRMCIVCTVFFTYWPTLMYRELYIEEGATYPARHPKRQARCERHPRRVGRNHRHERVHLREMNANRRK